MRSYVPVLLIVLAACGGDTAGPSVLHFDGSAWSEMPAPPTGPLLEVWGTMGSDVHAVGVGTILHYDGQGWSEILAAPQRLAGVWGSSATDVFVAGSSGTVLRGTALLATTTRL